MPATEAVLVDVFDTMLSVDFELALAGLVTASGLSADAWELGMKTHLKAAMRGEMSQHDAFAEIFRMAGQETVGIDALVRRDEELLQENVTLHADTVPFLERIREDGLRIAFVSNCAENTAPLLAVLGLADLADAVILSCEVRSAKPDADIYRAALDALGARAENSVMIDDQARYCAGAEALGIRAVQISRFAAVDGAVRSLAEVPPLLGI